MVIVQISDPHVTREGESPGAGVDAAASFATALACASSLALRPSAIVVSGDLVEHGSRDEYRRLASLIRDVDIPVWLMTGNHDDREAMIDVFPALARHRVECGLQYEVAVGDARLLLLDSLEEGQSWGTLGDARLRWLDEALAGDHRPTLVFVHHPPVTTGLSHVDGSALVDGGALEYVIGRHPQVVRVASGHIHRSMSVEFAHTTLSVCPSTAHQFALDLAPDGRIVAVAEAPGFHVHRLHAGRVFTYAVALR
jgi:3',5'-cyclic AMP phosphodiesterase CpdA